MQRTLIHLLIVFFCWLPIFASAATQYIHVEWGYTPPSEPAVTGFKLYQEGAFACQTEDASAIAMDCEVTLIADTTNFTLTATFSDGTESPHSTPFVFSTVSDAPAPEPPVTDTTTGSKLFTFSWETPAADLAALKGYKIYLNNAFLCETSDPASTSITCKADLIQGPMTFGMTQVATDGTESEISNLLTFDPTAYPELFGTKLVTFNWEYSGTTDITGFRIYQNNNLVCQTTDPTVRQLACMVDIDSSAGSYGLTAVNTNGTENDISNLLTYTETPVDTTSLKAVITASPLTGTAPFTVDFSAISSTGSISSFSWDFGDGATATGNTGSHVYTTAGIYTVKLTVTDVSGQTSIASTTVTATGSPTPATPPTAVISSSTALGSAPLTVNFNGSGSKAANGATIANYLWSFGDGASATGLITDHSFTTAGNYNTSLTVTDSNGLTNSISTPVMVTAATVENSAPTAAINATPVSGTIPLTVTLDGSASADSDGSIASYTWDFGDGSSATGETVTHTYTTTATFIATLQVADDRGATDSAITTITAQPEEQQTANLNIEMGEIQVTGDWGRVLLNATFQDPVVIAGPAGFNDAAPGAIRLRNVDATGFDIKFDEWNYLNGAHPEETVSYIVMEKGRTTLPDGSIVEAGTFAGATTNQNVRYSAPFNKIPVVITTVASENETDTISGRLSKITTSSFAYAFREQEKNKNVHAKEIVNFIAWEPGMGTAGTVKFEVAKSAAGMTHVWGTIPFRQTFQQPPLFLADMQTTNNTDTSALRASGITAIGVPVKVEEEQSKDLETSHPEETVGYLLLDQEE